MSDIRTQAQRHDRWVNWIVIGILVLALLGGWVVKAMAEGRTASFNENGLDVRYPAGWTRANVQEPMLLQVQDRTTKTMLSLQWQPVPLVNQQSKDAGLTPEDVIVQKLSLERGRQLTAYRVLETKKGTDFGGHHGLLVTFAYVEANSDPETIKAPVVMRGTDFLCLTGNQVQVATLTATEENYDAAQRYLKTFVQSLPK